MTVRELNKRVFEMVRVKGFEPAVLQVSPAEAESLGADWLRSVPPYRYEALKLLVSEWLAGRGSFRIWCIPVEIVEGYVYVEEKPKVAKPRRRWGGPKDSRPMKIVFNKKAPR